MKITIPKNEKAESKPTNYFFVTDLSGSMWGSISDLKETLRAVKNLLSGSDTFSLAYFSSHGDFDWICKGATLSNSLDKLIDSKIYSRGLTCFTQALASLDQTTKDVTLLTGNDNNVLFFLTDGYPNDRSPESEVLRLSASLKNTFVHKQIVGYSGYYNRPLLLEMTAKIGGAFNHVSDYSDMKKSCETFVSLKKTVKKIDLPKAFDLVWQVSEKEIVPLECVGKTVEVLESNTNGELFGVDYSELDSLPEEMLTDGRFVYSLAYTLSQKNKANLGVSVLRKAGALNDAKLLQKSFTVTQKGRAENELKRLALEGKTLVAQTASKTTTLQEFVKSVKDKISGGVSINLSESPYKSISRKGGDASLVTFKTTDKNAKIVGITGNEDRANVSFLTVRNGEVSEITDADLAQRVAEFNKTAPTKITLPITAPTFRNLTLVANGDFNFDKLVLEYDKDSYEVNPNNDIDLFDENQKDIKIGDFTNLYKTLIAEKAHASVLRYYIKANSTQKHAEDLRVTTYGADGALLLEEMGFDYAMRYAPKKEYKPKDENADYIPFLEITGQLKGAATINAKTSYEKMVKGGKNNVGDDITWPLFKKYDAQLASLGKELFVELCQKTLEGVEDTVDLLSQKVSAMKFYLMSTNSWFVGVDKSDEFEHEGVVVKTKEVNEYL